MDYFPLNSSVSVRINWIKIGIYGIIIILIFTIGKRAWAMTQDIDKIDSDIEKEALGCLQKFSSLNCPLDNIESSEKCKELYSCARRTKSTEHIKAFLEKAAYMAIF
jgi:hypothetical protein